MSRPRYVSAEKMQADDFGVPFTFEEGEIVYDARTKMGPWATMTEQSWKIHGMGQLGLGMGQKYRRAADGTLPKIA
jgi:hypothetical protein